MPSIRTRQENHSCKEGQKSAVRSQQIEDRKQKIDDRRQKTDIKFKIKKHFSDPSNHLNRTEIETLNQVRATAPGS